MSGKITDDKDIKDAIERLSDPIIANALFGDFIFAALEKPPVDILDASLKSMSAEELNDWLSKVIGASARALRKIAPPHFSQEAAGFMFELQSMIQYAYARMNGLLLERKNDNYTARPFWAICSAVEQSTPHLIK
jgi:hypothetical protein